MGGIRIALHAKSRKNGRGSAPGDKSQATTIAGGSDAGIPFGGINGLAINKETNAEGFSWALHLIAAVHLNFTAMGQIEQSDDGGQSEEQAAQKSEQPFPVKILSQMLNLLEANPILIRRTSGLDGMEAKRGQVLSSHFPVEGFHHADLGNAVSVAGAISKWGHCQAPGCNSSKRTQALRA